MMLVQIYSAAISGIKAIPIRIEVSISKGIRFSLVGLPDNAVRESHERIVSALWANQMDIPRKQITINMAPADIRKEGTSYDLPLAVGLMVAGEYIPADSVNEGIFIGELSLNGNLNPVRGVLPIAIMAKQEGYKRLFLPVSNMAEAAVVDGLEIIGIEHLQQLVKGLKAERPFESPRIHSTSSHQNRLMTEIDLSDVKGQEMEKRALEVACAGGHNLLLIGPPGSGKSMMAKCIPGILPPMSRQEALETTVIHSVAGKTIDSGTLIINRPFRTPHHSISPVAMTGGGSRPQPGEISLAHNGVLYLDEFPEFNRNVLEVLRQPLEDRNITINRAQYSVKYPANVMLIASMNPCPCGHYNDPNQKCLCNPGEIKRYMNRISGPLLDRLDLQIECVPVPFERLREERLAENNQTVRERVIKARNIQQCRFSNYPGIFNNAMMSGHLLRKLAQPDQAGLKLLERAMKQLHYSARGYDRILKVSRTIADLADSVTIGAEHIAEAIQYRKLDRSGWGS